ncbi:hypothetical protein K3N28_20745 [Glycomyces sp. TRM65418]|uniref:hypothetical protein n=1 Tax=Glycomyces sp. TRM65418 TaxID=2867006 RepID=UPI001CE5ABA3|nr:hypothetical protein [Glycomyces sp. TRM65418]MCC3765494.1 hypothetical protein [Glycomyces sp. TRM65418]QZD55101.1 hypothetical protein K3N28_20640 [Glycomyces sp. TRM65418]
MNLQDDDPGEVFRKAMPEAEPPPARFDLDRIVRDGYRVRRRHRAVLGGAAASGVAAVAAVLALSVTGMPGTPTGAADDPSTDASTPPEAVVVEDPAMAGYPYAEEWGTVADGDWAGGVYRENEEAAEVKAAATEAFGQLLAEAGVWDDPANTAPEDECSWILTEDGSQEEFDACIIGQSGMPVGAHQKPGNYGQTFLRSFKGGESEEEGFALRTIFEFEVALPGGWTAEPGPITEQLFPQHFISDGPYFTEEAPEFTTEQLDAGRTLMIADHDCAAELAIVYPNGTGLRVTWNNCSGTDHPLDLGGLVDAAASMPEFEFDTSELRPVEELNEVPMGWVYDEDDWANSAEAEGDAAETYEIARTVLREHYPDATLEEGGALSLGQMDRGANMQRSYSAYGTLPIETTIDSSVGDVAFNLRYYLPGGWIPGFSETGTWDGHLTVCKEGFVCDSWSDDDGTTWAFEEHSVTHEPMAGEDWEAFTEHEMYATRYSPGGWAVGVWLQWTDDAPIDADMVGELLRAMPAPVYDEEDVPTIPAG